MKKRKETWKLKVMLMNQLNIYFFQKCAKYSPPPPPSAQIKNEEELYIFSSPWHLHGGKCAK
jgi:hypothetical protein